MPYSSQSIPAGVGRTTGPRSYGTLFSNKVLPSVFHVHFFKSKMGVCQGQRGRVSGLTTKEYGVSFEPDENGLELDTSDTCITL